MDAFRWVYVQLCIHPPLYVCVCVKVKRQPRVLFQQLSQKVPRDPVSASCLHTGFQVCTLPSKVHSVESSQVPHIYKASHLSSP